MARWDKILTLPIQSPASPSFSSADLTWSRVEGWKETVDRLALIPHARVCDFLRGESQGQACPTRFHVEARRTRPAGRKCKAKVDGILEYILYWCSFGPDDHRSGGSIRPSRLYTPKNPKPPAGKARKAPAGRPNTKRGCTCHFIVKRLIARPSVALIIYNKHEHVDKNGLPCHGVNDESELKRVFGPGISDEMGFRVLGLLRVGVPVEAIMQRHGESVERNGGPSCRDDLLSHRCVRTMERKIRRETYELDPDDSAGVKMWVQNNPNQVFFYEDFSDFDTFTLGIQTDWQLEQMIKFGNKRLLASDSKFGTNKLKYPVYSLLVFDSQNNAIPVAWVITPNYAIKEIHKWIGALYNRARNKDASWQLGGFVSDDPSADLFIIREVLQCSVLLSFWRVRHSWHKNVVKKCPKNETRAEIMKKLGEILHKICSGSSDISLFEAFLQDFSYCHEFSEYFKATWFPRLGAWIEALKSLPISTSEVSSALETYHHLLKTRLINPKTDSEIHQNRTDWLVHELCTKVHSYFWFDNFPEKESFSRYSKAEWKNSSTFQEGLNIPIGDITIENNLGLGQVVCQKDRAKIHVVQNPGTEFCLCDCTWSKRGYICKHAVKLIRVCRERGLVGRSLTMVCYERALKSVLSCGGDSLVRDHAVGLTVRVRAQLGSLFEERERERKKARKSDPEERERERERRTDHDERERVSGPEFEERERVPGPEPEEKESVMGPEPEEREIILGPEPEERERVLGPEPEERERVSGPEPEERETVPGPEFEEREREIVQGPKAEERENSGDLSQNVTQREKEGTERNDFTDLNADMDVDPLDPPAGDESEAKKVETREKNSEKTGDLSEKVRNEADDLPEGSTDERRNDGTQNSTELILQKCNGAKKADVPI